MKKTGNPSGMDVLERINLIEKEVMDLRLFVIKKLSSGGKRIISLKGILKGEEVSEKEITSAQKSLYSIPRS
jgi:hypothetical protein